ncbi:VENN motif pre-toxin domain-containing protein [Erwinia rhapontici]|uniref:VENN motif pre-toxin domain-containing protein n=1 Tax=Erwinia rhapontici TaxID=55212 RepID=UPI003B9E3821
MGISSGGSVAGQFVGNMANGLLAGMNGSGSDSSTTKAAVSEGTIIIRDAATQQQDVEGLSRDVEHANQTLSPIFDKEKEQRRLKEAQLIGEIGSQAADIARTQGQIEATRAANDKMKSVTPEQLQAARKAWSKANPGKEPTDKQINEQAYQTFYDKALAASDFGTGGKVQRAIQAATAAVQGLAGGDLAKAVAGGSAPYIANIIGNSGLDSAGKVLAHAAVNAALAAAQGNSALVGATGAATAELAGIVAVNAYGKPVSELSETEKQTVSALATLAAGLAGGLAGDGTADALAGAQAGKTTVENNSLAGDKARESVKQSAEHWKGQVRDKLGNGTTSSIANGIINALADTGDTAIGSVDYVADAAMALASCATGDGYCDRALSDLSGKNQAVADGVKALMQSETWSAVADTLKQASEGNQVAMEATGGMLAGIILPGKKVPGVVKAVDPTIKIATGITVGEFESSLFKLPPGERVAIVKQTAPSVASAHQMIKDNKLTKMNNRDVYRGTDGNLYALDTQHGRFEVVSPQGKHIKEVNFAMKEIPDSKDKSGGHNLRIK